MGLSKNYTNQILGDPIIENSAAFREGFNDTYDERITTAGYKLDDCVVLCMYEENSLVAFAVVVNNRGVYDIPPVWYGNDWKLLEFTYYDHTEKLDDFHANLPANNDDYAYYYETHFGGGGLDYNYYILGSYKDYNDNTWIDMVNLTAFVGINENYTTLSDEKMARLIELRQKAQPNMYGIVSSKYADTFNFVFDVVGSREVGAILFNDWR